MARKKTNNKCSDWNLLITIACSRAFRLFDWRHFESHEPQFWVHNQSISIRIIWTACGRVFVNLLRILYVAGCWNIPNAPILEQFLFIEQWILDSMIAHGIRMRCSLHSIDITVQLCTYCWHYRHLWLMHGFWLILCKSCSISYLYKYHILIYLYVCVCL